MPEASAREFDYVIVGAGSAGCALAHRLSEDGANRVLLLEAGGWDRDPFIHIPLGWGRILVKRLHDWGYFCEPEPNVDNRRVECARGKIVGGCSSTNAMAHVRGNRADFDRWARNGSTGWSYADALPYFKRQENWSEGADSYRGGGGPIATQPCRYSDPLVEAFAEAGDRLGYAPVADYNGAEQQGFGQLQMTIKDGRRCSAATGYLRPALERSNLSLEVKAHALGLVFQGDRAVGLRYRQHGVDRLVRAAKEVILSAGVINTPQILALSGIGDPDELAAHDIAVRVAARGVGRNLQDHVSAILLYRRSEPGPFHAMMRADRILPALARNYLIGKGFAGDVPGGTVAFLRSDEATDTPDLQLLFTAAPLAAWPYLKPFKAPFADGFATRVVMTRPESRGAVRLASRDPFAAPRIHQNFLSSERDWRALRQGVRIAREAAAQPAMARFVEAELAPGATKSSDDDIDAHIRATSITVHHPAGTCRMGASNDDAAVVDTELRVRGVEGLRVVDASVMPDLPNGNINAAVMMIAERAADLILDRAPLAPERPD